MLVCMCTVFHVLDVLVLKTYNYHILALLLHVLTETSIDATRLLFTVDAR
jgi:hypothetical protein